MGPYPQPSRFLQNKSLWPLCHLWGQSRGRRLIDLYDFNTIGHNNNMISHYGARICLDCLPIVGSDQWH